MRALSKDAQVNYVAAPATEGGKSSIRKGKIIEVRHQATSSTPGVAVIEFSEKEHAISEYSTEGELGTFHFPDEAKDVKQSDSFKAPPPAAAPATAGVNNK